MSDEKQFAQHNAKKIEQMAGDADFRALSQAWFNTSFDYEYSYHFEWMGRPIIQYPQDIIAMQEIIWRVKPELIIEVGIARGGGTVFYASMLALLGSTGQVLGIDIDIREHNRQALETHPMFERITLLEGSSIAPDIIERVYAFAKGKRPVLVVLDSMHTHAHVLLELQRYAPLVTPGSYLVVFDTMIEDMPEGSFPNRPWDKGDNPKTAVHEFLKSTDRFEIDKDIQNKLLITVAPDGYLKCVK
ncbi:MAG: cephalosporin hydroxylase family protein [Anaerolineales bacterium]